MTLILIKKSLHTLLLVPVLLLLLFEEWGWEPLARGFAALGQHRFWGSLERRLQRLPPWGALLAFGGPVLLLIPIKLLALYWIDQGNVATGLGLVLVAKLVGTALAARLFQLTEPALMQIRWFARLYIPWKQWKDRMLAQVRRSAPWRRIGRLQTGARSLAQRSWSACKAALS